MDKQPEFLSGKPKLITISIFPKQRTHELTIYFKCRAGHYSSPIDEAMGQA